MDLIADVGGTNTRCALVDDYGAPVAVTVFANAEHDSLVSLLRSYLDAQAATPAEAAVAVAAPISGDSVRMTNRQWHFSTAELRQDLGLRRLEVINDFTAVAMALPRLEPDDLVAVGHGRAMPDKAMAVLGAGTGLGVSGLIPGPGGWCAVTGEGGHVTLAPGTPRETQVVDAIRERLGHCSAERLVSGPGLALLYETLCALDGDTPARLDPPQIPARADAGDSRANEALDLFFALLGSVAGNLALTLGALGGVFIGGGIAPKLLDRLIESDFRERFEAKGRYTGYLEAIPTSVIMHRTPALLGLASLV